MPARIVVVHDEPEFTDAVVSALLHAGWEAVGFLDPMAALDALGRAHDIELLITRVRFGLGKPHGISLALMARHRRPKIKLIFTALPEYEAEAIKMGAFLPLPIDIPELLTVVDGLLARQAKVAQTDA